MTKKSKKEIDKEVDAELESKSKEELLEAFDKSQALHVPAKKRENILISIRLPENMIEQLREIAVRKGDIGYQQMIKTYIAEGILGENSRIYASPPTPFLVMETSSSTGLLCVGAGEPISGYYIKIA